MAGIPLAKPPALKVGVKVKIKAPGLSAGLGVPQGKAVPLSSMRNALKMRGVKKWLKP